MKNVNEIIKTLKPATNLFIQQLNFPTFPLSIDQLFISIRKIQGLLNDKNIDSTEKLLAERLLEEYEQLKKTVLKQMINSQLNSRI